MTNQEIFLAILKNFVHPTGERPFTFTLQPEDWEMILQMAAEHAVLPVVYEAVWKNPSFQQLPLQMREQIKSGVKRKIVMQMQSTNYFLGLYSGMTRQGITPLVMKGLICRQMYGLPDHRISGDEDMLVKREEYSRLDAWLIGQGFQRAEVEDVRTAHEITYYNVRTGSHLEVHLSLFPDESGSYGRLNQEFEDVFERQSVQNIFGVKIHTLNETQHMLYLLCHGLKHFLHSGFGIRQLCDMVLFAETYGEVIDWEEIRERTRRQHMYVFWMNLFDIGERYLGFSWEKAGLQKPADVIVDSQDMLDDMLKSGIYGKSSSERVHSANITLQAADQTEKKQSGLLASLFPELSYMSRQYPYLKKRKWLLPVAWLQRIFSYGKKMQGKNITGAVETGKQRVELLRKYEIIEK